MNYKEQIDPELKQMARIVPYNKLIITCANLFQVLSFHLTKTPKEVAHRRFSINGYQGLPCKVDVFEPANETETLPCLIYVHGGAFSYKASAFHKKLACLYAVKGDCRVYFPDYHLMPKYPYPAAYDDALALYRNIMENSRVFRIDPDKIGLAGDSAGASIAALLCNNYEREGLKQPRLQMLVYPVTDVRQQTDSMKKYSDTPLWNSKSNRRMWSYYGKNLRGNGIYAASPMQSALPQIIPDTYIETAEFDCLRDEGVLYGKRLHKAGAKVICNETRGTFHGYDSAMQTKIVLRNLERRISFLQKGFHGGSSI